MTALGLILAACHLLGFLCALHALMSVRTPQGTIAWFVSLNTFPSLAVPARAASLLAPSR